VDEELSKISEIEGAIIREVLGFGTIQMMDKE
jgi:hypothetical protein